MEALSGVKYKVIYLLSFIYLLLPNLIFIIGYTKPTISIPLSTALLTASFFAIKHFPTKTLDYKKVKKVLIASGCILLLWVVISGVGGLVWQNRWDHKFRNAVFNDLVFNNWPVSCGTERLCYYLGFWFPSAIVGKAFGIEFGYLFQLVYAVVGVFLTALLMFEYMKSVKIWYVLVLVFFSGMDAVVLLLQNRSVGGVISSVFHGTHMELLLQYFNSSSNTTLLFWLYNQIIPFWVGFLLLLLQKTNRSIGLIYACMVLFCPFPAVAIFPIVIYLMLRRNVDAETNYEKIGTRIKTALSFQNAISVFLAIVVGSFLASNHSSKAISVLSIDVKTLLKFFVYFLVEYGVFLLLIYPQKKKDRILQLLIAVTIPTSFVVMGSSYDFAWRTCIPLSFYLMLSIIEYLEHEKQKQFRTVLLIVALLVGMLTPVSEMLRTARGEYHVLMGQENAKSDALDSIFEYDNNECRDNFISDGTGLFFEHIAK